MKITAVSLAERPVAMAVERYRRMSLNVTPPSAKQPAVNNLRRLIRLVKVLDSLIRQILGVCPVSAL